MGILLAVEEHCLLIVKARLESRKVAGEAKRDPTWPSA